MKKIINAKAIVRTFEFDKNSRLRTIISPLGYVKEYQYDPAGNRKKRINPDGHETEYIYDKNYNLIETRYDTGKVVIFKRDVFGQITNYKKK